MTPEARHQCLIYAGAPSRHLPALAATVKQKLNEGYRCLCLDSPVMIAGMRCYLAAAGIDVALEVEKNSLVLSSDQRHLVDSHFDIDKMMRSLGEGLDHALGEGYKGLWATGDLTWEFGPDRNFSKLLEYEWRLEEFIQEHRGVFGGVCQYHADTLPREALRQGLVTHPTIFLNSTLSQLNPHYLHSDAYHEQAVSNPAVNSLIAHLCDRDVALAL
jgi:MEDS: MEthanogen/methylotroph, DcmR Sensory domain